MGETALPPVELYEEPHLQKGYRAECDLALPDVQRRYLEEVRAGGSTVHWIACPCTTFCDWNLQNGGTRTFQCPAGTPTAKESNGNLLSEFGAKLFEASLAAGGFPIAESSGTSGRYPKQWHLPRWQKIIQRPDVDFIELDMCAFGLQPVDGEAHHFYKHRTGLVFRPTPRPASPLSGGRASAPARRAERGSAGYRGDPVHGGRGLLRGLRRGGPGGHLLYFGGRRGGQGYRALKNPEATIPARWRKRGRG